MVQDDGDIVRGLGFVSMYSAWVEESVDDILRLLSVIHKFDAKVQRLSISKKLKHAAKIIERVQNKSVDDLPTMLRDGIDLFEERNELVHGRIYPGYGKNFYVQSGRPNMPIRAVTSAELYSLANDFANYRLHLIGPQVIRLPKAITSNSPSE